MKISVLPFIFLSFSVFAGPLKEVTVDQPICYGREYSESHMQKHPLQTVKQMRLKFYKDEYSSENSALLDIQAQIKRTITDSEGNSYETYKPYSSGMGCSENGNRLECSIDCDGGSAKVAWNVSRTKDEIIFRNQGFVMVGGCGDEENDTIWLDPKRGGDDVFRLYALPKEFCQR